MYVCPSHQFPLGMVMSLRRRRALLDWAERVDAAIIEDDYDSEFRFGGRPLEPLHRLDSTGRVLYVGSLSKVAAADVAAGVRDRPPPLHEALRKAKHVADWHTSVPLQAAAAAFIEQGHLARHIRRMRGVYTARHLAIQEGLGGRSPPTSNRSRPRPGCTSPRACARPQTRHTDTAIVARAEGRGVVLQPLSMFRMAGTSTPPRARVRLRGDRPRGHPGGPA